MHPHEWTGPQLLRTSQSYWQACALHAAVKLDVFTALGDEPLTGKDLSQRVAGDERGVTRLLNALAAMNLLSKLGGRYANTAASRAFLSKGSPQYLGHIMAHHHHLVPAWARLDRAVTTGKPTRASAAECDDARRATFLMGMFDIAMQIAPMLVPEIDLAGRRRLLDLGGGPGTYAIHFCQHNLQLRATVFDLPSTRPFAEQTIERFGLAGRIDFMAGNYLEDGLGEDYDAAWLSHILHSEGPENCQRIVQKAASALRPGGLILVHEFLLDDTMAAPVFPALFSLNMLVNTDRGQSYSQAQIMEMLARAGAKEIRRLPLQTATDSGVIAGTV